MCERRYKAHRKHDGIMHYTRRELRPFTVFEFQLHTHRFESIASISVRAHFSGLSLSSLHG